MGILSWYVTSQTGQLSLLSSVGQEMSTSQDTVAVLCGWEERSSITPIMHHELLRYIHLRAQWTKNRRYSVVYGPIKFGILCSTSVLRMQVAIT